MEILILGNETLRQKSVPVTEFTPELEQNIQTMFDLMNAAEGVGLAAPQVGILQRYFVCQADDDEPRVFVNPQIIATSQEVGEYEEGCLSIPKMYEKIVRPLKVTVQAQNEKGKPFTMETEGLLARIVQHEYDHLEGILYIDRGDPAFKKKAEETIKRREARRLEKERLKQARAAKIARQKAHKAEN